MWEIWDFMLLSMQMEITVCHNRKKHFWGSVGFFLVNFSRISTLIYHQGVAGQAHAEELDRSSWNREEGRENYESLITHFSNDRTVLEKYLHLCSRWFQLAVLNWKYRIERGIQDTCSDNNVPNHSLGSQHTLFSCDSHPQMAQWSPGCEYTHPGTNPTSRKKTPRANSILEKWIKYLCR